MTLENTWNEFAHPAAEYTACPFWFWNGDMEPGEMLRQIGLMHGMGLRSFVIHARVGLGIKYLSDEWFDRCRIALDEAARLGMKVWIYDEDNWPSGYAGGRVIAANPEHAGRNVNIERCYVEGPSPVDLTIDRPQDVRAVIALRIEHVEAHPAGVTMHRDVAGTTVTPGWADKRRFQHRYAADEPHRLEHATGSIHWAAPPGKWCIVTVREAPTDWYAAYSDLPYVDLLSTSALRVFIDSTHEVYHQKFAHHFGSTILGFFVDEPAFYNNFLDRNVGSIPWTGDLAAEFRGRRGYDLTCWLPALWEDLGPRGEQARADYWLTVGELLEERFFGALANWCAAHGVALTGHLLLEEWMLTMARGIASPFSALRPLQVPAVDKIDEVTDKISEKLVSSIAHAHGRKRVMSESFALIGWKLAPAYMKRITDYQFVRGVNWLSPHAFFYSIEGFRQNECPPSEFFQNPWWSHSRPYWDYVARLSSALSAGQPTAPVALYYPIEHTWATMTGDGPGPYQIDRLEPWQQAAPEHPAQSTDLAMQRIAQRLLAEQYDYEFVDHEIVSAAATDKGELVTGAGLRFRAIVIPPLDAIAGSVLAMLVRFATNGGTVIFTGRLPTTVLWRDLPAEWTDVKEKMVAAGIDGHRVGKGTMVFSAGVEAKMARTVRRHVQPDVRVISANRSRLLISEDLRRSFHSETLIKPRHSAVRYCRRALPEGDVYFFVNESAEEVAVHVELLGAGTVEQWHPDSARRERLPAERVGPAHVKVPLDLKAWDSVLLVVHNGVTTATPRVPTKVSSVISIESASLQFDDDPGAGTAHSIPGVIGMTWTDLGHERFSGCGTYRATFEVDQVALDAATVVTLDLGQVLETAQVTLNGHTFTPMCWAPFTLPVGQAVRAGRNELIVRVANTNANHIAGVERPAGLMGPINLYIASDKAGAPVTR